MDATYKAVLTAVTVAAVLMAARLIGRRVAGMLAGLPVITVPALLWLAQEQGTDFAVQSAVGSAAACAMAPLFAATFVGMARRHGAVLSLGCAVILAWAAVTVLQALQGLPALALLAATASCVLVLRAMGAPGGGALRRADAVEGRAASARRAPAAARALTRELSATAAVAGLVSAAVSLLAREVGPYWSGVLSTLPLISACALLHLHHVADHGALRGFFSGYVLGVLAKALFVCVFAWTAPLLGAAASMVVAALAGGLGALCVASVLCLPPLALLIAAPLPLGVALAVVVTVCLACVQLLPRVASRALPAPGRAAAVRAGLTTAMVSGAVSAMASLLAPHLSALWAGALTSPPILAAAVAWELQRQCCPARVLDFLRGYTAGLIGRCAFVAVFGALLVPAGLLPALSAALVLALVLGWGTGVWMKWRHRIAVVQSTNP